MKSSKLFLPILISYAFIQKSVKLKEKLISILRGEFDRNLRIEILVDSGAFTQFTCRGKPIDINIYTDFIDEINSSNTSGISLECMHLDRLYNPKITTENLLYMLKRNLTNLIPVVTEGTQIKEIDFYYENSPTSKVALGTINGAQKTEKLAYMMRTCIRDRKVHWLGYCDINSIRVFTPYSVDASTWAQGARFGILNLFYMGRLINLIRPEFMKEKNRALLMRVFGQLGFSINAMDRKENWYGWKWEENTCQRIGTESFIRYLNFIYARGGTRYFLCATAAEQVEYILKCAISIIEKRKRGIL